MITPKMGRNAIAQLRRTISSTQLQALNLRNELRRRSSNPPPEPDKKKE